MKNTLRFLAIALLISSFPAFAEQSNPNAGNCELRLVSNAGAGEIFMSIFTPTEEDCLNKSDRSVEAKFRNQRGNVIGRRGGAGPKP